MKYLNSVLGGLGLILFLVCYPVVFSSFPRVEGYISKEIAESISATYLKEHNIDISGFKWSSSLKIDEEGWFCLFQEIDHRRIDSRWMGKTPHLLFWEVKGYNPSSSQTFNLSVGAYSGKIEGFSLPQTNRGERTLSKDEAEKLSTDFLTKKGINLANCFLASYSFEENENERHVFEWKEKAFSPKKIFNRVKVVIEGETITSFQQFLANSNIRKEDDGVIETVSLQIYSCWLYLLIFACLFIIFRNKERSKVPYLKSIFLITAVVTAITIISIVVDCIDTRVISKEEGDSFSVLINSFSAAFLIVLFGIGGSILAVRYYSGNQNAERILCMGKSRKLSVLKGYEFGFLWAGYFVVFHFVSQKIFNLRIPAIPHIPDIPEIHNLIVDIISIANSGLSASVMEEFTFRLVSILLLIRYIKRKFLAVLIPAIIWGFTHPDIYFSAQYFRGIELSLVGIVLGYIFLQYGILTPMIAHYIINILANGYPMVINTDILFAKVILTTAVILFLLFPLLFLLRHSGNSRRGL